MNKIKLVCFDLDETLIRGIHSVMLPCILNGKEKEHSVIQKQEEEGALDCESADYLRAELFAGLKESKIAQSFLDIVRPLKNIKSVVDMLHSENIQSIVITVGPKQVAKAACNVWGFDGYYGSDYEVIDGVFTGKILDYVGADQKIMCLKDFCERNSIKPMECMAVGDGSTDIPIFEYCRKSIAINASSAARAKATYAIDTNDLADILKYF